MNKKIIRTVGECPFVLKLENVMAISLNKKDIKFLCIGQSYFIFTCDDEEIAKEKFEEIIGMWLSEDD